MRKYELSGLLAQVRALTGQPVLDGLSRTDGEFSTLLLQLTNGQEALAAEQAWSKKREGLRLPSENWIRGSAPRSAPGEVSSFES
ncbi:hypothetical protein [Streptomyces sp. NRRL B-3648]|uniref:hypothetical protein n=1 Tax=Streptomyces sp. NRRL B-3648 TaxID=1519493 RepID=UPI0006B0639B|nr:hypothetical protein [Streptomyces sp. NRRL B-3648]KOX04235.1 hypothetical protein ADL04_09210 [Streptomyces sp. NRRL B-3648]